MSDTQASIEDRVIDFFAEIFRQIFFNPCAAGIDSRIKRNKVERAVADAADAASQAITRFLLNERLRPDQVEALIGVYVKR
ncbi:MAG: hypothetical protein EOM91_14270 [Sphingobacteriia bacterium]|nr:hypothetical protein [Sphingobacteriia bacterium]NCC40233.1 hypothetical protein [Gammaproteobacteria bacterium]